MIRSMTGFVSQNLSIETKSGEVSTVSISLKSLNSRFFETTCKLPYILSRYETELVKKLKSHLTRGHAYLIVYINNPNIFKNKILPANNLISNYLNLIKDIKKNHKQVAGEITISDLLNLPNIFVSNEENLDNNIKNQIFNIIEELCLNLNKEREREGKNIKKDLLSISKRIKKNILAIEKEFVKSFSKHKSAVKKKIELLETSNLESNSINPGNINSNNLANFLDKLDIHEEITRFNDHLNNLVLVINSLDKKTLGKQIDFILQECNREINTMSAKATNSLISSIAIEVKVEIEKAREQVQNIV